MDRTGIVYKAGSEAIEAIRCPVGIALDGDDDAVPQALGDDGERVVGRVAAVPSDLLAD
jgi:hypothetical protein